MQTFFDAFKNMILNLQAIGWEPWSLFITAAVMVGGRLFFEEDIVNVNTEDSKRQQIKVKQRVALGAYVVSVLSCYAFDYPKGAQEHLQAFAFSILNVLVGYVAYTVYTMIDVKGKVKSYVSSKLGGANTDTKP